MSRFGQFVKMSWMLFWRGAFFGAVLNFPMTYVLIWSMVPSAILAFGFGKTVRIWPIFNLILLKNPFLDIPKKSIGYSGYRSPYSPQTSRPSYVPPKPSNYIDKVSQQGLKTGFEPYAMEKVHLKTSPYMIGNPGGGLAQSNFGETEIRLGQQGEVNFAKALQKTGMINKFDTFWSTYLPKKEYFSRDYEFEADVDCVIFTGSTIYLVDLKNYKGGDLTYRNQGDYLTATDNKTGNAIRLTSGKMSYNMKLAKEKYTSALRGRYRIEARVVIMPQNNGQPVVDNLYWPGMIKAMTLTEFLNELHQVQPIPVHMDRGTHSGFYNGMDTLIKR